MKIAIITSLNGGVAKFTMNLSRELSHFKGISKIDIYGFMTGKRIPIITLNKNVNIIKLFSNPLILLLWLLNSLNEMKKYDIIQIHQAAYSLPVLFLKLRYRKIKIICSLRTAYIFEHLTLFEKIMGIFDLIALTISFNFLEAYTTFSEFNRYMLKEKFGLKPFVIHNGIDPISYFPTHKEREIIRQKLGFSSDSFVILYLGLLLGYKNVIDLISSLPYILKQVPHATLYILGRGPFLKKIISEVKKLKMEDYVTIETKFVKETTDYYLSADLFAFPAADGTHVLLEAMACGLPIVYANSCSSPEIVGDAGISFKTRDVKDLYEKIVLMATDDNLRMEKTKKAKERIKYFDWSRVARKYYKLYI